MSAPATAAATSATETVQPQAVPTEGPKHTATKGSRFHIPAPVRTVRTVRASLQARSDAKALRQGVEDEQRPTSHRETSTAKAARKTAEKEAVKATKTSSERRTEKAARKVAAAATMPVRTERLHAVPMVTVREAFAVDGNGEATPVLASVMAGYANTAGTVGETINDLVQPSLWATLFETAEQRARRVNYSSVANTLILTANLAARIAAARAGRK